MPLTEKEREDARDEILDLVDDATVPESLSPKDALEWLEDLLFEVQTRIDAVKDEG